MTKPKDIEPLVILESACQYARDKGSLIIAASGNYAMYPGLAYVEYPAAFPSVVAVGSTNSSGNRSSFSCYGPELDLAAPGEYIWSLYVYSYADFLSQPQYGPPGNPSWVSMSAGTSDACPIVSALGGLIASQALPQTLSPDELELRLLAAGMTYPNRDDYLGYGEVNFMRTLDDLLKPTPMNLTLGNPYPNPFKPGGFSQQQVSIPVGLGKDGNVRISIYDISGRIIKTIWDGWMPANSRILGWDGRDETNFYAAQGVYIIRHE